MNPDIKLAEMTGEAQAVEAGLADRLLAIGVGTAARLHEPFRNVDHGDLLYDEQGSPA